jgi:putative oligomerization/nucleic acid binding protein
MMLGGVGFQTGLDEARRKQIEAQREAAVGAGQTPVAPGSNLVQQLQDLKALHDSGALSSDEFQIAKSKVLGG